MSAILGIFHFQSSAAASVNIITKIAVTHTRMEEVYSRAEAMSAYYLIFLTQRGVRRCIAAGQSILLGVRCLGSVRQRLE